MKYSNALVPALCVAVSLSLAAGAMAQSSPAETPATKAPAAPQGQAVLSTVTVTATITKIDQKTREVTVKDEKGKEYSFVADEAVKNFAQMKKGDVITATYTEALAYVVKKDGELQAASTAGVATAAEGEKPAAVAGHQITATVVITAIDPKIPSVTFKGPQGNERTIKVQDPSRLEGVSVGDKVDVTYTEAVAVKVTEAAKKPAKETPKKK